MKFTSNHIVFGTADIEKARSFYKDKLKLEVLEEEKTFFALRLGDLRLSFFGGCDNFNESLENKPGISIVIKVSDIEEAKIFMINNGIKLHTEIITAGNFMKFFNVEDPDGNTISFGEYMTDPLLPI